MRCVLPCHVRFGGVQRVVTWQPGTVAAHTRVSHDLLLRTAEVTSVEQRSHPAPRGHHRVVAGRTASTTEGEGGGADRLRLDGGSRNAGSAADLHGHRPDALAGRSFSALRASRCCRHRVSDRLWRGAHCDDRTPASTIDDARMAATRATTAVRSPCSCRTGSSLPLIPACAPPAPGSRQQWRPAGRESRATATPDCVPRPVGKASSVTTILGHDPQAVRSHHRVCDPPGDRSGTSTTHAMPGRCDGWPGSPPVANRQAYGDSEDHRT